MLQKAQKSLLKGITAVTRIQDDFMKAKKGNKPSPSAETTVYYENPFWQHFVVKWCFTWNRSQKENSVQIRRENWIQTAVQWQKPSWWWTDKKDVTKDNN